MKSLFKKPEWAATKKEENPDFYRRSGQTYSDIVAASQAAHHRQKTPTDTPGEDSAEDSRRSKRRRTSEEPDEGADVAESTQVEKQIEAEFHTTLSPERDESAQPEQATFEKQRSPEVAPPQPSYQSPLKKESHYNGPQQRDSPRHVQPAHNDNPVDRTENKESPRPISHTNIQRKSSATPTPPADDPIVQILITSDIPNCNSLIVHRKMSQGLKDVRVEWCRRQNISDEAQSSVYLTWRGRRLFDVTTCKSLGVKPEKNTNILGIEDDSASEDQESLRIHMVAVTENTDLLNRPGSSPGVGNTLLATATPEDQQNEQMKLILRNPDFDDFKIKARPRTLVSKLISAFRDRHSIPGDQDLSILFDGDRLNPDDCLRDHDIADLDMLEVQVKP